MGNGVTHSTQNATGFHAQMQTPSDRELASPVVDSDFVDDIEENSSSGRTTNIVLFQEFILSEMIGLEDPYYSGITCLSDGRVVILDCQNNRCCFYDSSLNHMSDVMLSSQTWDICTVDTDEVAVTLPYEKKIYFLKIADTIQPSRQITTRRNCQSIVALNKMELVYVGTTPEDKTYYWGVITMDGWQKSCYHIPRGDCRYCAVYIALNSSKTRAYISCYGIKTVHCVGLHGAMYFEYKVKANENRGFPSGIQLDRENNVYVVVNDSHCIHRLSPNCQLQQIVTATIPQFPIDICFRQSDDNFLLTKRYQQDSNVCYVYRLR